jgi:hypothetical protein
MAHHHTPLARDRFGEPYFDHAGHRYRLSRPLGGWVRARLDDGGPPEALALRALLERAPAALRDAALAATFEAIAALAAGVEDLALADAASPWARGDRLEGDTGRLADLASELREATSPPVWLALATDPADARPAPRVKARPHLTLAVDNSRTPQPDGTAA